MSEVDIHSDEHKWYVMELAQAAEDGDDSVRHDLSRTLLLSDRTAEYDGSVDEIRAAAANISVAGLSAVVLEVVYDASYDEIAEIVGAERRTVVSRIRRASKELSIGAMIGRNTEGLEKRELGWEVYGIERDIVDSETAFQFYRQTLSYGGAREAFRSLPFRSQMATIMMLSGVTPEQMAQYQRLGYATPEVAIKDINQTAETYRERIVEPLSPRYGREKNPSATDSTLVTARDLAAEDDFAVWARKVSPLSLEIFKLRLDGMPFAEIAKRFEEINLDPEQAKSRYRIAFDILDAARRGELVHAYRDVQMDPKSVELLLSDSGHEAMMELPMLNRFILYGGILGLSKRDLAFMLKLDVDQVNTRHHSSIAWVEKYHDSSDRPDYNLRKVSLIARIRQELSAYPSGLVSSRIIDLGNEPRDLLVAVLYDPSIEKNQQLPGCDGLSDRGAATRLRKAYGSLLESLNG